MTSRNTGKAMGVLSSAMPRDHFSSLLTIRRISGSYPPNARGLFDMHGNVWEWCLGQAPHDAEFRPIRGGGYLSRNWDDCRSAEAHYLSVGCDVAFDRVSGPQKRRKQRR